MMKLFEKNSKGELTTAQLITILILIASFVVILFLFFRLGFGEETQKEICHNSVVLSGKSGFLGGSIDCSTNDVCISGGNDCEDLVEDYKIDIALGEGDMKKISDAINQEIEDCWWMFGQGKVEYGNTKDVSGWSCAVCNRIKFDKNIQEKYAEIVFDEKSFLSSEEYVIVTATNVEALKKDLFVEPFFVDSKNIQFQFENENQQCSRFLTKP